MNTDDPAGPTPPADSPDVLPPAHRSAVGPSAGPRPDNDELDVAPPGPPWTLDVLADLHAGRYAAEIAGPLRQRIAGDPWAASVLTALDTTVDELSLLPTPRMPERFALRLDAAIAGEYRAAASAESGAVIDQGVPQPRQAINQSLSTSRARSPQVGGQPVAPRPPLAAGSPAPPGPPPQPALRAVPPPAAGPPAESAPTHPASAGHPIGPASLSSSIGASSSDRPVGTVHSLAAARSKRRRWVGGLVAAAAVIAVGTATVASLNHSGDTGGVASAPSAVAPAPAGSGGDGNALQLDPGRFGDALTQIEGKRPAGSLQDAATYSRCLAANAINPSAVTGVRSVTFDGAPAAAIAVVIDTEHSKVVVVGPKCGINGAADQLAAQTVTR